MVANDPTVRALVAHEHGEQLPGRGVPSPPPCSVAGCPVQPTDGKPYCKRHVLLHPRAAELHAEVLEREREAAAAALDPRAVDPRGSRSLELLSALVQVGPTSPGALAAHVHSTSRALEPYLVALARRRLLRVRSFGRRSPPTREVSVTRRGEAHLRAARRW